MIDGLFLTEQVKAELRNLGRLVPVQSSWSAISIDAFTPFAGLRALQLYVVQLFFFSLPHPPRKVFSCHVDVAAF